MLEDLQHLGIAFVSLGEGNDCTTPAGKLQLHILAALAEFERERIRERVLAGLQRASTQGKKLGRPQARLPIERLQSVAGLPIDSCRRVPWRFPVHSETVATAGPTIPFDLAVLSPRLGTTAAAALGGPLLRWQRLGVGSTAAVR